MGQLNVLIYPASYRSFFQNISVIDIIRISTRRKENDGMTTKEDEEFVKAGAEKITEKDVEKVVDKSEEIRQKFAS